MKNWIRIFPNDRILQQLPETARILESCNIIVHPAVKRVLLHGSRGTAGGYRNGSDLDLSLVADSAAAKGHCLEAMLSDIITTTLTQSHCTVELDVAVLYDMKHCDLICLEAADYANVSCPGEETGCMGVYKIQKGFHGFVPPILRIEKIFPFLVLWERDNSERCF